MEGLRVELVCFLQAPRLIVALAPAQCRVMLAGAECQGMPGAATRSGVPVFITEDAIYLLKGLELLSGLLPGTPRLRRRLPCCFFAGSTCRCSRGGACTTVNVQR